jgi:hypothetical protein
MNLGITSSLGLERKLYPKLQAFAKKLSAEKLFEEIAVAIEKNKQFSSECLEVKPSPIGPEIVLKGRNEDEIIKGARELTKAYKQNPKLRSKIYSGLKTDFPSSFYENSFGDFGYKVEEEEEKDEAALELIEAIQASEAVLNARTENGERVFGYNPVSDKLHYILDSLDRKRFNGVKVEEEEEIKENLGFIKRYKKPLIGAAALALGATVVYPSLVKGKLTFDPGPILKDVANMLSRTYINPHTIFNNLNPAIYLMSSITRRETFDVKEKGSVKRKLLYGLLGGLLAYEIGDIFFGFPGLVDLGETVYLVYNMRPSDATYPWQWKWSKSWNLALKTSDLDSLRGIFTGNSELLKLINYYHQISRLPGIEGDHEIVYDFISPLFSDGKISPLEEEMVKKFMIYHPKVYNLIPEDIRKNYYTNKEVYDISRKLIEQLFSEGNPSPEVEDVANNLLSWKRWWIVRDIINSGMINEKNLKEDWDLDNFSNITEILSKKFYGIDGSNPLEKLETPLTDESKRYAVIINSIGDMGAASENFVLYHLLKRNGYGDEDIYIFFSLMDRHKEMFNAEWVKMSLRAYEHIYLADVLQPLSNDTPMEIDYFEHEELKVKAQKVLDVLKALPSDKNDNILLFYVGHGSSMHFYGTDGSGSETLYADQLKETIDSMKYGRFVLLHDACHSEIYLKNLKREGLKKGVVGIASMSADESGGAGGETFFEGLERGLSIRDAVEYWRNFNEERYKKWGIKPQHPVMYIFDTDGWEDYFNFFKYRKNN